MSTSYGQLGIRCLAESRVDTSSQLRWPAMVGPLLCVVIMSLLDHICSSLSEADDGRLAPHWRDRRQAPPALVLTSNPSLETSGPTLTTADPTRDARCPGWEHRTTTRPPTPTLQAVVPAGYDQFTLPTSQDGGPVPVSISAKVRDIQKIDEQNMDVTIEWYLRLYWQDSRLNAPLHLPDEEWLNIAPEILRYIWLPTTYIDHVREVTKPTLLVQPESIRMKNNGLIRYSMSVTTRTSCPMDFSAYPFDKQVCYFRMESYQFTSKQVSYNWFNSKIERTENIQSGHFDFDFYSVQQQNTSHSSGTYPMVTVEVKLTRRISYHLMNTFLPSGLFVCVSWLTFLVPVDQVPGRMVLTITTLLTLVSMFAAVRQESPKVSYAKAVDQWMIMCVVFVFCVLLEFTIAIRLHELGKREARKGRSPPESRVTTTSRSRASRVFTGVAPSIHASRIDVSTSSAMEHALISSNMLDDCPNPGVSRLKERAWKVSKTMVSLEVTGTVKHDGEAEHDGEVEKDSEVECDGEVEYDGEVVHHGETETY
ncbi:gamma-aminobutyric acid receptor subunit pi-like [Panulirus ornatus]|uniref:gamma-aminobutyric acid receptor subunit pi-like n=1 Tax=Panulirus ornatus TaxID=150431 RepID=UPI003A83525A